MTFSLPEQIKRLETARSGPFTFQIGAAATELESLFLRVKDAERRLRTSPLSQVANRLEKEVVVSSIFGTNSIEGGTLTEQETGEAIELDPATVNDNETRRAVNLKAAYDYALYQAADKTFRMDPDYACKVHALVTNDLPHEYNRPSLIRDNPAGITTHVGDATHGGRYKPPQYGGDVQLLMEQLFLWHRELQTADVPALIRAPLVHYYFEAIHPFWDGNGRVGRVLEATILLNDGFRYAPFTQARYYFEHIDQYFTLFNTCRQLEEKHQPDPNSPFLQFFLEGMLDSINQLHDRVNALVTLLVFESRLKRAHDEKTLNTRQYVIVSHILERGRPLPVTDMRKAPWYLALYEKKTDKTKQRDMSQLKESGWLLLDGNERLWASFD